MSGIGGDGFTRATFDNDTNPLIEVDSLSAVSFPSRYLTVLEHFRSDSPAPVGNMDSP